MKEGWTYKKLGEVCEKSQNINWNKITEDSQYTYIDLSSVDRNSLSITDPQIIDKTNAPSRAKQIVKNGDIIFATTRPTLRRLCLIPLPFDSQICSTGFCVLRPKKDVDSRWIYYTLQSDKFYQYIEPLQTGASYPAVTDGIVKEYSIILPPLSEQHRIVSRLDSSFAHIDELKANAEKQLNDAKALFQKALEKAMEPKEGWEEKLLKDLTSEIGDGLHGTPKYSDDGRYYFVNGNNLENGIIEIKGNTKRVGLEEYEKYKIDLNSSTVLLSINGTIGKTAFYEGEPIILGKSACYINVLPTLLKEFLRYFLLSGVFVNYANRNSRQATIINLGLKEIRNMPIPLPPPSEQQQIVTRLDNLSANIKALEENLEKTISECDALKQAILREVFE